MIDDDGLHVVAVRRAGGAVTDVADGNAARLESAEHVLGEDVINQSQVFVGLKQTVIVHYDAAGLLSAVLQ